MRRCLNCMNEYPDEYRDICPSCGYMDGTTQNGGIYLQPGSILQGRYIVGTVLKERDTDIFYIGWDALFDRKVQLQEYFPRYCATRSGKAELSIYDNKQETFQAGLELFYQQSRQMIRLYKEEDVITYHACFRENGTAYAVMEVQQEATFEERLKQQPLRLSEAEAYLDEVITALMKAHQIGIFHGQLAPDSFWLRPGGLTVKDFGASRYISGEPGIVDYGCAGPHTDVYGAAKLFCWLVTGKEIEDGEKLEGELARGKLKLKKSVVEALKRALFHRTKTMENFQKELWGRRKVPQSRKKKKEHGSLSVPRWVIVSAAGVMAVILLFTGLVATGVIDLKIQSGASQMEQGSVRVPNVTNMDEKKAKRKLAKRGLELLCEKKVYSEEIPENMISYQEIRENTVVNRPAAIKVWISLGKEKGVVPTIIGLDREEALVQLQEAGFINIEEDESQDEGIFNSVLKLSEEQGANVALSQKIVLTICKNETAQSGDSAVQVAVPDIMGKGKTEAEASLQEAGLQINWVEENSGESEGTVLGQEPAAGGQANKDSFVTVRISIGAEKMYMKNVELMTKEEAETMITDMELSLGEVTEEYSDSVEAGKIISQSIAKDTEVKKGDTVKLVISKGKAPAAETPRQTSAPKPTSPPKTAPLPIETAPPPAQEQTQAVPETSAQPPETTSDSSGIGGSGNGIKQEQTQGPANTTEQTTPSTQAPTAAQTQAPVSTQAPAAAQTQEPLPTQAPAGQPEAPTAPAETVPPLNEENVQQPF